MKLVLHIGAEKTGTSSIQHHLHSNRDRLASAGIHVLQCAGDFNHRALAAYALSDDDPDDYFEQYGIDSAQKKAAFRGRLADEFRKEIESLPSSVHTVLITSEHFHSRLRTPASVVRLHTLLAPFFDQFLVIAYLREQGEACVSWYSTSLKFGECETLNEFMLRCTPQNYYFDYATVLANWRDVFGAQAMQIALFTPQQFFRGSLLDDFCQRIDPELPHKLKRTEFSDNESLTPAGQSMLLGVNRAFQVLALPAEQEARLRNSCERIIYRRLKGVGQQPDPELRREIYSRFASINERVRREYFSERDVLFEPPVPKAPGQAAPTLLKLTLRRVLFRLRWLSCGRLNAEQYARAKTVIQSTIQELE